MAKNRLTIALKWGGIMGAGIALLTVAKMFAGNLISGNHNFSLLLDILMIGLFFFVLIMGIREYRDSRQGTALTFSSAYGTGALISLTGFVITILYMLVHYNFIEKDGLDKIYKRNLDNAYKNVQKKPVTQEERNTFIVSAGNIIDHQKEKIIAASGLDSTTIDTVSSGIDTIKFLFRKRIENLDSTKFTMTNFDSIAKQNLISSSQGVVSDPSFSEENASLISTVILSARSGLDSISPLKLSFEEQKSNIQPIEHVLTGSLVYSFSVLLYGLFFSIFASLFTYRKKTGKPFGRTYQNTDN